MAFERNKTTISTHINDLILRGMNRLDALAIIVRSRPSFERTEAYLPTLRQILETQGFTTQEIDMAIHGVDRTVDPDLVLVGIFDSVVRCYLKDGMARADILTRLSEALGQTEPKLITYKSAVALGRMLIDAGFAEAEVGTAIVAGVNRTGVATASERAARRDGTSIVSAPGVGPSPAPTSAPRLTREEIEARNDALAVRISDYHHKQREAGADPDIIIESIVENLHKQDPDHVRTALWKLARTLLTDAGYGPETVACALSLIDPSVDGSKLIPLVQRWLVRRAASEDRFWQDAFTSKGRRGRPATEED